MDQLPAWNPSETVSDLYSSVLARVFEFVIFNLFSSLPSILDSTSVYLNV